MARNRPWMVFRQRTVGSHWLRWKDSFAWNRQRRNLESPGDRLRSPGAVETLNLCQGETARLAKPLSPLLNPIGKPRRGPFLPLPLNLHFLRSSYRWVSRIPQSWAGRRRLWIDRWQRSTVRHVDYPWEWHCRWAQSFEIWPTYRDLRKWVVRALAQRPPRCPWQVPVALSVARLSPPRPLPTVHERLEGQPLQRDWWMRI